MTTSYIDPGIVNSIVNVDTTLSDHAFDNIVGYVQRSFYQLQDDPIFAYNQRVEVDCDKIYAGGGIQTASVVGRGSIDVVKHWLCKFDHDFGDAYPYTTVCVPHMFIIKYEHLPQQIVRLDDRDVFVLNSNKQYELQSMQNYKQNKHLIHAYDYHTLMVVHKGRFTDQVIFDLLQQYRPQQLQAYINKLGGEYSVC